VLADVLGPDASLGGSVGAARVTVAHEPAGLARRPRAVAIGTFDGVHRGHRAVIRAATEGAGPLTPTVVTFHPHPRTALGGNRVELLSTLRRRLELLADCGVEDVLVVEFTPELAALSPEEFAHGYLAEIGAEVVVAGDGFRFGRGRSGDLDALATLGFRTRTVPLVDGVSSTRIRQQAADGRVREAAGLLGRPLEVDGTVVTGEQRGGTLGFPTANLLVDPDLLVPEYGIYAGAVGDRRAAVSIGVNPHYGGTERRIEAYLLDWSGDLYGDRLVVELWRRLRDERAFANEAELVDQIARDVDETRSATRPVTPDASV
jgi:riboflavin kinase/FMN adenylyltransferase